jgi:EpsI family protein
VLHGLFVSGIGHVTLFVGLALLMRGERRHAAAPRTDDVAAAVDRPATPHVRRVAPVLAMVLVFWATAAWATWRQPAPVALAAVLDRLPTSLGAWHADPYLTPAALPWWPGADDSLRRTYRSADRTVDVHIAYFTSQRQSREVVTYRASELHRAAHGVDAALDADAQTRINVADERLDGAPKLTVFWYELDGAVETTAAAVKLRTLWHAIGRGRSNGAVICLRTDDPGAAGRDAVLAQLTDLAGQVHRGLAASLPGRAAAPVARTAAAGAGVGR